jgi:hypothetical protein
VIEGLEQYATTGHQRNVAIEYGKTGDSMKCARALNLDDGNVRKIIRKLKARAAKTNPELHNGKVPEPYELAGVSTYTKNKAGEPMWVKTRLSREAQEELLKEFTESFCEEIPKLPPTPPPKQKLNKDIIPWFQIGDAHIGMLAHSAEIGHNFDLKIAERELVKAMIMLIYQAPDCERCVIQDLGDSTHYENYLGVTEAHRHALDYDGRFPKMVRVYARIMRAIIEEALKKFKYVDIIVNQGNHSRTNDVWMVIFLRHVYENEKRVHVLNNSSVFIPYRMGNTFVMCHHGDKARGPKLIDVMKTDFRQDFGEAKYKYIDCGHIHTRSTKEVGDVVIETWNQLAPADKYAHDGGWRSRSCLTAVLRSKTYGEKGRIVLTAEEVKDILNDLPAGTSAQQRRKVYTV